MTYSRTSAIAAIALLCTSTAYSQALEVDNSMSPGQNFYAYANGPWLETTTLPDGVTRIDSTSILRAQNARRIAAIVKELVAKRTSGSTPLTAIETKIADYYLAFRDREAIAAKGLAPLSDDLGRIAAINDVASLSAELGRSIQLDDGGNSRTESLLGLWVHQNFHDPERYAAHLVQGGLGLGDAEDYLTEGNDAAVKLVNYRTHIASTLAGADFEAADERAGRIVALETEIARAHAPRTETDDVFKTDNTWQVADFAAKAPGIDWDRYLAAAGLENAPSFVVWQPQAVRGMSGLVASQPLDVWKDYLAYHRIEHYRSVLPPLHVQTDASSDPVSVARAATELAFADALGKIYIERHYDPRQKAAANVMVENIRIAFADHLARLSWMTDQTKAAALRKLASLEVGIAYPEQWIDYSDLTISRDDALGNLWRVEKFTYEQELARLERPVDPQEWARQLNPQLAGAILSISPNSMQFAAGILQPPYFDAFGDAAANYGSAGAGIAHEISHSFDEIGNLYDDRGRLVLWWTDADRENFRAAAAPLKTQLDQCTPADGMTSSGERILTESTADIGGMQIAYDAYHLSLKGKVDSVRNGLTGDQRFFIAFAQRWRRLQTAQDLATQARTDSHAIPQCRGNLVRNSADWARAFGVKPGDALYIAPDEQISVS